MSKVLIWRRRFDGFDLVGQRPKAPVNFVAIRDRSRVAIGTERIETGAHCFEVGNRYVLNISGLEVQYEGQVDNRFLLFRVVRCGHVVLPAGPDIFGKLNADYEDIYLTYIVASTAPGRLFWLIDGKKECSLQLTHPKPLIDE